MRFLFIFLCIIGGLFIQALCAQNDQSCKKASSPNSCVASKNKDSASKLENEIENEIDDDDSEDYDDDDDSDIRTSITLETKYHKIRIFDFDDFQISDLNDDELMKGIERVTKDGLVLKKILKEGTGPLIPENSLLVMNVAAYLENEKEPFATTDENDPARRLLIDDGLTRGLEEALTTMRKGEKSRFWIHHSYAYGAHGRPPHVPGKANIIYEIEVVNFINNREATEIEEIPEDQKNVPFSQVRSGCKLQHEQGNKMLNDKNYKAAGLRYSRVVKILEQANAANEEENKERDSLLLKMYLNLAVCHLQEHEPNRAIIFAHKALNLDKNNLEALYHMVQAHISLGNLEEAKSYLLRAAKNLKPDDEVINADLLELAKQLML